MRTLAILAVLILALMAGCREKNRNATRNNKPLRPTRSEREMLRAFKLRVNSERGQHKLREWRAQQKRIQQYRDKMRKYVEEAERRRAAERGQ